MRFMIMHKNDPQTEAGHPPPMTLVQEMGAFIGEHARAGRLVDGAGLGGSKTRTRLVFRTGRCTKKRGPYSGEHELPAGTLLLKVRTHEEAVVSIGYELDSSTVCRCDDRCAGGERLADHLSVGFVGERRAHQERRMADQPLRVGVRLAPDPVNAATHACRRRNR